MSRAPMTSDPLDATGPELRLEVANRTADLTRALEQLDRFLKARQAAPTLAYAVRLVLEELLTNTIKYGYDDCAEHRIRVRVKLGSPATMRVEDDGHPFNPQAHGQSFESGTPANDRPLGGLGLHLVRSLTTSLQYRRIDDINRVDVVF